MGGSGSGNCYRYSKKDTVDGLKAIDINWLNRKGYLQPGRFFTLSWTYGGEPSGWIQARTEQDRLILEYRWRYAGGEWESVEEPVNLTWTPCNYGGRRPWFICPGVKAGRVCGRRVGKLYSAGKYFLCRHCYDLTYQTRREDYSGRLMLKAQNIQTRLGGQAGAAHPFPDKPKGMHWSTYSRLCREYEEYDTLSWIAVGERFGISLPVQNPHRRKNPRKPHRSSS